MVGWPLLADLSIVKWAEVPILRSLDIRPSLTRRVVIGRLNSAARS